MGAPALAGLSYGAGIFALGFLLGTLRELALAPLLGRGVVVLFEGPLILLAAWFAARSLTRRFDVPPAPSARLAMGAVAFAVLMIGEALIAAFGFGRTLAQHVSGYATPRGALELMPQLAFAMFPLIQSRHGRSDIP
jgi:hypothetical protein